MKVTVSGIYRIRIEASCGCAVEREYKDVTLVTALNDSLYHACAAHQALAETTAPIFKEMHEAKVKELGAISAKNLRSRQRPSQLPNELAASIQAEITPDIPVAPAAASSPTPQTTITNPTEPVAGIEGGTVRVINTNRPHRPNKVSRVVSTSSGVKRVEQQTTSQILQSRGASGIPGARKVASTLPVSASSGGLDIDIDGGAEDPDITDALADLQDEMSDLESGEFEE